MDFQSTIRHCTQCGESTNLLVPEGDDRVRHVCTNTACGHIQYINPKVVCGCLPVWEDKILLCKRSIEPRSGYLTLPAGFMELGETLEEAAVRETWEEARAKAEQLSLYRIISLPTVGQIYVLFHAIVADGIASPGPESESVQWFTESTIPWESLAFSTITSTLKDYCRDRSSQQPLTMALQAIQ